MSLRRFGDPDGIDVQPELDLVPRVGHWLGALEYPRVGDDAQECQERRPWHADAPCGTKLGVEPCACTNVLRKRFDVRVDEQVGVEQDHRNDSPSARASASATSSTLPMRQRPRSTVGVWMATRLARCGAAC